MEYVMVITTAKATYKVAGNLTFVSRFVHFFAIGKQEQEEDLLYPIPQRTVIQRNDIHEIAMRPIY